MSRLTVKCGRNADKEVIQALEADHVNIIHPPAPRASHSPTLETSDGKSKCRATAGGDFDTDPLLDTSEIDFIVGRIHINYIPKQELRGRPLPELLSRVDSLKQTGAGPVKCSKKLIIHTEGKNDTDKYFQIQCAACARGISILAAEDPQQAAR